MTIFKIGDKVKVKDVPVGCYKLKYHFHHEMKQYLNQIFTISQIIEDKIYFNSPICCCYFIEEWLELMLQDTFKAGDKVKVKDIPLGTKEDDGNIFDYIDKEHVGKIGVIQNKHEVYVLNDSFWVLFEKTRRLLHPNWLELVSEQPQFKTGDLVKVKDIPVGTVETDGNDFGIYHQKEIEKYKIFRITEPSSGYKNSYLCVSFDMPFDKPSWISLHSNWLLPVAPPLFKVGDVVDGLHIGKNLKIKEITFDNMWLLTFEGMTIKYPEKEYKLSMEPEFKIGDIVKLKPDAKMGSNFYVQLLYTSTRSDKTPSLTFEEFKNKKFPEVLKVTNVSGSLITINNIVSVEKSYIMKQLPTEVPKFKPEIQKFKVGDLVKVKDIPVGQTETDGCWFTQEYKEAIDKHPNKIFKILTTSSSLYKDKDSYICVSFESDKEYQLQLHPNWLELVELPPPKFKVGDVVDGLYYEKNLEIETITLGLLMLGLTWMVTFKGRTGKYPEQDYTLSIVKPTTVKQSAIDNLLGKVHSVTEIPTPKTTEFKVGDLVVEKLYPNNLLEITYINNTVCLTKDKWFTETPDIHKNLYTKTLSALEKVEQPKFKVGDIVKSVYAYFQQGEIIDIKYQNKIYYLKFYSGGNNMWDQIYYQLDEPQKEVLFKAGDLELVPTDKIPKTTENKPNRKYLQFSIKLIKE